MFPSNSNHCQDLQLRDVLHDTSLGPVPEGLEDLHCQDVLARDLHPQGPNPHELNSWDVLSVDRHPAEGDHKNIQPKDLVPQHHQSQHPYEVHGDVVGWRALRVRHQLLRDLFVELTGVCSYRILMLLFNTFLYSALKYSHTMVSLGTGVRVSWVDACQAIAAVFIDLSFAVLCLILQRMAVEVSKQRFDVLVLSRLISNKDISSLAIPIFRVLCQL